MVENGTQHFPTNNPYFELFVEDKATHGFVWLQRKIGKIVLPLPIFRDIRKVEEEFPKTFFWMAGEESTVVFTAAEKSNP